MLVVVALTQGNPSAGAPANGAKIQYNRDEKLRLHRHGRRVDGGVEILIRSVSTSWATRSLGCDRALLARSGGIG